jgi:hypothetical protein
MEILLVYLAAEIECSPLRVLQTGNVNNFETISDSVKTCTAH